MSQPLDDVLDSLPDDLRAAVIQRLNLKPARPVHRYEPSYQHPEPPPPQALKRGRSQAFQTPEREAPRVLREQGAPHKRLRFAEDDEPRYHVVVDDEDVPYSTKSLYRHVPATDPEFLRAQPQTNQPIRLSVSANAERAVMGRQRQSLASSSMHDLTEHSTRAYILTSLDLQDLKRFRLFCRTARTSATGVGYFENGVVTVKGLDGTYHEIPLNSRNAHRFTGAMQTRGRKLIGKLRELKLDHGLKVAALKDFGFGSKAARALLDEANANPNAGGKPEQRAASAPPAVKETKKSKKAKKKAKMEAVRAAVEEAKAKARALIAEAKAMNDSSSDDESTDSSDEDVEDEGVVFAPAPPPPTQVFTKPISATSFPAPTYTPPPCFIDSQPDRSFNHFTASYEEDLARSRNQRWLAQYKTFTPTSQASNGASASQLTPEQEAFIASAVAIDPTLPDALIRLSHDAPPV